MCILMPAFKLLSYSEVVDVIDESSEEILDGLVLSSDSEEEEAD